MRLKQIFIALWLVCIGLVAVAQNLPQQPMHPRLVNDWAHVFSFGEASALEQKLLAYNDSTSTQIVVVTVKDLQGMDKAMFATELAERWGIGQKGKDNGILILLKPKTPGSKGQVYIAVGYGLEAFIPDATTKRIISQEMMPYFKQGQMFAGVNAAVDTIFSLLMGKFTADAYNGNKSDAVFWIVFMLILSLFVFLAVFGKKGGSSTGSTYSSSGFSGFSGGSGFGGSSGGGFGGFGGGSFGGGGAGGSW